MSVGKSTEQLTQSIHGKKHVIELQSIRGIAALIVVLHHCSFYFSYRPDVRFALEVLFNAHAAVVCFFVLSGFVLALSWGEAKATGAYLGNFYVRRAFRIYPALWAATILGLSYVILFRGDPLPSFVNKWWPSSTRVLNSATLNTITTLLGYKTSLPIPVWTLQVELVGSLLLPLLAVASVRYRTCFFFMAIVLVAASLSPVRIGPSQYLVHFALGVITYRLANRTRVAAFGRNILLVGSVGLLLLWSIRLGFNARFAENYNSAPPALLEGVGASLLIYAVYCRPENFGVLKSPAFVWLGDISYSLYLIHMPVLGLLAGILAERLQLTIFTRGGLIATAALTFATLLVSLPLAALLYRFIEIPGLNFGKYASRRLTA